VLIFISHRRKEVYQRTQEREESEVGKAAPPGGSSPWVSGDRRRQGSVGQCWAIRPFGLFGPRGRKGRVGRCPSLGPVQ
jgi:hypothetical protein